MHQSAPWIQALLRSVALLALLLFVACGGGGGSGNSQNSDTDDEELSDIVPRDEDIRPLEKKRFVTLSRQVEYVQIGANYRDDTQNNLFVIDPLEYNYNADGSKPTVAPGADDLLDAQSSENLTDAYQKAAASGMMDDDIQDEVALVSWPAVGPGQLSIIDPTGEPDATNFDLITLSISLDIDGRDDPAYDYDIVTGDVDGDGYDEIVVAGSTDGATPAERSGALWIIDDAKAGSALLETITIPGVFDGASGSLGLDQLKVAAGNVDEDWADEIAIAFASTTMLSMDDQTMPISFTIFDDQHEDFAILHDSATTREIFIRELPTTPKEYFNIAMGDMDRDGRAEIALAFMNFRYGDTVVEVFDDNLGKDGEAVGSDADTNDAHGSLGIQQSGNTTLTALPDLRFFDVVDIDGDRADEIFIGDALLDDVRAGNPNPLKTVSRYNGGSILLACRLVQDFSFGDVNGDMREDIVVLYRDGVIETVGFEEVTTYDSKTGEVEKVEILWYGGRTEEIAGPPSELTIDKRGGSGITPVANKIIVGANLDNDSTILEYSPDNPDAKPIEVEEAHTTYYSQNHIIAVLAAPPAIDGLNTEDSSTSFGQSSGNAFGAGAEVSVRAGVLVGAEVEVQAGLIVSATVAKFEAELTAEIETAVYGSTNVSVTKTITYSTGEKEDRVIFSTTPYDRYQYIVTSHPDPQKVGKGITIDVPQEPKILSWSKDYYNSHNGDQLDIGPEILGHTPGDIGTYPTRAQKDHILSQTEDPGPTTVPLIDDGLWWLLSQMTPLCDYGPHTVQEGTAPSELEVELVTEQSAGGSITASVDFMAKACGATVCGGITGGFSIGASFESTWSKGTSFAGAVGGIPGDLWEENSYDFGLFSYRQALTDDETNINHNFVVLNYWVEK